MRKFYCVFVNKAGLRLTLFFNNPNWHTIEEAAIEALDKKVEYHKHGPWCIDKIDVAA